MRKYLGVILVIVSLLTIGISAPSWKTALISVHEGQSFDAAIQISVPKGYFLYADKLDVDFVALEGVHVDDVVYPAAITKKDPLTGKTVEVYDKDVNIVIKGIIPKRIGVGIRELVARVSYQGCTSRQCFRPKQEDIALKINIVPPGTELGKPTVKPEKRSIFEIVDFSRVLDEGIVWTLIIVLLAGILTSLTPCVLPIIPVMLVVIGVERQRNVLKNALLTLSLIAGLVLVYSILGVMAAALGKNLGFVFQHRWFVLLVAVFFITMSLSLFGVFEIHLSSRWANRLHRLGGEGFRGAFLSGMGLGLIASPCSGPVIAALLGYVALQKSYFLGFALLVVFGLGMGIMIFLLGTAYGVVSDRLRSGQWMVWVKRSLGVLLLIPAAFYVGSLFHWKAPKPPKDTPSIEWVEAAKDALVFARQTQRPVMMDFYANWCPPCRRLDRSFFIRDDIVKLSYQLVPVRVDATYENGEIRKLMDKYCVMGMPTFVFLAPDGTPYEDLKITAADGRLLERNMKEAIRRASDSSEGSCEDRGNDEHR